jgi:hypothetical protein
MEYIEIDNYPEDPGKQIVENFCNLVLQESDKEIVAETMKKLLHLGDKQWHTYELPSKDLQQKIRQWLINNWVSNSDDFLEGFLITFYNFALDKEAYIKALDPYRGKYKSEFKAHLENSHGDNIDPWWTLKRSATSDNK